MGAINRYSESVNELNNEIARHQLIELKNILKELIAINLENNKVMNKEFNLCSRDWEEWLIWNWVYKKLWQSSYDYLNNLLSSEGAKLAWDEFRFSLSPNNINEKEEQAYWNLIPELMRKFSVSRHDLLNIFNLSSSVHMCNVGYALSKKFHK